MPANQKYLTTSKWKRFAKITAGVFGGYAISASLHMLIALWFSYHKTVLITAVYSLFLVWMLFFILAFLFKSPCKIWAVYLVIIAVNCLAVYYGKLYHQIV